MSSSSKSRVSYATASPYAEPVPEISASVETDLLQLLLPLLKPLGTAARKKADGSAAKGRSRSKKRNVSAAAEEAAPVDDREQAEQVKIGFNSVVRELETLVGHRGSVLGSEGGRDGATLVRPAAVIACSTAIPMPFLKSLPLLVALAGHGDQSIRLVGVSPQFEAAVSKAALLPRVGLMALYEDAAQGSKALINYIRDQVAPVQVPWLEQARSSSYLPLKIHAVESAVEPSKSKKRKGSR